MTLFKKSDLKAPRVYAERDWQPIKWVHGPTWLELSFFFCAIPPARENFLHFNFIESNFSYFFLVALSKYSRAKKSELKRQKERFSLASWSNKSTSGWVGFSRYFDGVGRWKRNYLNFKGQNQGLNLSNHPHIRFRNYATRGEESRIRNITLFLELLAQRPQLSTSPASRVLKIFKTRFISSNEIFPNSFQLRFFFLLLLSFQKSWETWKFPM